MTNKFIKMCEIYKIFAKDWDCDFSDEAKKEMYIFESTGKGDIDITGFNAIDKKPNGYAVGKKWLNVTVSSWMEIIEPFLKVNIHQKVITSESVGYITWKNVMVDNDKFKGWYDLLNELYNDNTFPHWWLDEVFKDFINDKEELYKSIDFSFKDQYPKAILERIKNGSNNRAIEYAGT